MRMIIKKEVITISNYIIENKELMKEWDYEKNNVLGIFPDNITIGSNKKAWWICDKKHSYESAIYERCQGQGCPYCSNHKLLKGYNDFATRNPEILKEWDYEKNDELGIKPDEIILGAKIKVWWRCEKGHEYQQKPYDRVKGVGCLYCSGHKVLKGFNDLATTNPELIEEWDYEKNNEIGIYPEEISKGTNKKVWWKCSKGHEWQAEINPRTKGVGCPYCSRKKAIKGENDFKTLHPTMMEEWDYEENDKLGIKPDEVLDTYSKEVNWICSKGHKYKRVVYDRVFKNFECPYCTNRKVKKGYNDLATTNPELLKEWNYEKNDKLGIKPTEITNGGRIKVWWKCEKGHEWDSIIRSRITGSGCPYCSNNKVLKGYNDLATTNPEALKDWDYKKNEKIEITPYSITHGSTKKVWWKCKKGHEYKASVAQKIRNIVNCPICSNQQLLKGYNDFATKYPELLKEWNYEKNDKLGIKPDDIVLGGKTKFWWKCEKGHEWKDSIFARLRKNNLFSRCPICSSYLRTSIPEKIIYYYIKKKFPQAEPNYRPEWLKPKEIDIFIPEINIGIEYDGEYYHHDVQRDIEKDEICFKNNVNIIRIREKNSKQIDSKAIVFTMEKEYNGDYAYIEDALRFLNNRLNLNIEPNIKRDLNDIFKMINFLEKENCIAKTNPEVLGEWDYTKNSEVGITPENMSAGSSIKAWWKCENGHEYLATIATKIAQATGCPYCKNKTLLVGFNDFATKYPELLKEWNYAKNNKLGIKPNKIYSGTSKNVWWKCENGHEWKATLNARTNQKTGCPYCSGRYAIKGETDLATTDPELMRTWDYEKNNKIGLYPQDIKRNTDKKAWWICDEGHEYQARVVNRTKGTCCPYCMGTKVLKGFNDLKTTNPELLKEWDYEKNDKLGIKPDEVTNGTHKKVWWICDKKHSYEATIPNRRNGTGCPYCAGNKVMQGFNDIATTNPELLLKWNYEKNNMNGIRPEEISKSYSKKVWWKCKNGHEYQRYVYNQRNGSGKCPICKE